MVSGGRDAEGVKTGFALAGDPLSLRSGFMISAMPLSLAATALPLLLAATPLPSDAFRPWIPTNPTQRRPPAQAPAGPLEAQEAEVETFDPIARAQLIAGSMPRQWIGSYGSFENGSSPVPVQLAIDTVTPVGQMVVMRGRINVAGTESPVQGNLNAKSDQLDLLLLGDTLGGGLEAGGSFQGVQGLTLSGWNADRLTSLGGRLLLQPGEPPRPASTSAPRSGGTVRGLW